MLSPQLREDLEAIFELFGKEPYMGYKSNVAHQKKALKSKRKTSETARQSFREQPRTLQYQHVHCHGETRTF